MGVKSNEKSREKEEMIVTRSAVLCSVTNSLTVTGGRCDCGKRVVSKVIFVLCEITVFGSG